LLYLHTDLAPNGENNGVNIVALCEELGLKLGRDLVICDQYANFLGFPESFMQNVYRGIDVLLNAARGEGFGIPALESQACGTPTIVGDWTAMPEICFGGWKIPKDRADRDWTALLTWQYVPRVAGIVDALDQAYKHAGEKLIRGRARAGALAYDADVVTQQYWKPVLERIGGRLHEIEDTENLVKKWREAG